MKTPPLPHAAPPGLQLSSIRCPEHFSIHDGDSDVDDVLWIITGFGTEYDIDDLLNCLADFGC